MLMKGIEAHCGGSQGRLTASSHSGNVVMLRELGHLLIEFADPVPDEPSYSEQETVR